MIFYLPLILLFIFLVIARLSTKERKVNKIFVPDWQGIHYSQLKPGDKVKVAVGFSDHENEGVVSNIVYTKDDKYCWIDQYSRNTGDYIRSFTASFSYCKFKKKVK